jgi:mono/diheme cytochrome c family protein
MVGSAARGPERAAAPPAARRALAAAAVALLSLSAAGCTWLDNLLASIPTFSFLREAPAFDPYEAPRTLPQNAVPFAAPGGVAPPPLQPTEAALTAFGAAVGPNPVPADSAVLARGQELYLRFCMVCHGPTGAGNGPVVFQPGRDEPGTRFPMGPSLQVPSAVQRTDGYIYGIIRVGRGLMPPYGDKIPDLERWYVVHYVRQLQQAAGAAPAAAPGAAAGQTR